MTDTDVRSILSHAVHAPSGDNAQPWRFKVDGSTIELYNVPAKDSTLYNFKERGSYLAHGALIENITIAAQQLGFQLKVYFFPGPRDCTARITLEPTRPQPHILFEPMARRTTNRKSYENRAIPEDVKRRLLSAAGDQSFVQVDDRSQIVRMADAVSFNEQLLMEDKNMHDFLFGIIRYSAAAEKRNPGLYIKTMELPPPVEFMFRTILRSWTVVRFLNRFGFSRSIPQQSSAVYRQSAAFGAIVVHGHSDESYVHAGMALQRIWLTATHLGLSMQPIAGIPYLAERIRAGQGMMFSQTHRKQILAAYDTMREIFGVKEGDVIAMQFRIGYAEPPTAYSSKQEPAFL